MTKIEKYARLAIEKGVNLQEGQKLLIRSDVESAYFARTLAKIAWEKGAKDVMIRWQDERFDRDRYLGGSDDIFGIDNKWFAEQTKHIVDEGYQMIAILSSNPESFKGIDPERVSKEQSKMQEDNKPLRDLVSSSGIQWNLIAIPCAEWASKVFPEAKSEEEAIEKMWEAIFVATRIDDNDPIENWNNHIKALSSQAQKLQDYNFKSLIFKNSLGTNLEIGLPKDHVWVSCGEEAKTGNAFIANIPTEEVFTAPHKDEVNGIVYATKPLVYLGNVIDKFWVKFEKGRAVEYKAEIGNDVLEKMITVHPNADFLGEVALVPQSSPISTSGILWYNTLYDENASCHIALGNGYSYTVAGTEGLSEEELMAKGLNQSMSHNDFMIGSACLEIIGKTYDAKDVPVFKDGEWAI
ncbi:MAG: aminopeptidase [Defluviitaleaceae bacterium]|nr:aminopeptidase [Defluviitaleaceae bacterium]